jgi:hypothetical protein
VKVIWVMIFLFQTKRKATGGDVVNLHRNSCREQDKYLGSYYAVSDFKKVNPEFGTF